jgi:hypothetical protein
MMEEDANIYDQNQVFSSFGLDQQIIRPDIKSNVIFKRVPQFVEVEDYVLNDNGNMIPVKDNVGTIQKDKEGKIIYESRGKKMEQSGWKIIAKPVPAPNFASINRNTSNLDDLDMTFLLACDEQDAFLMEFQEYLEQFGKDLAKTMFRHNAYRISLESLKKGKDQVTVQAIKTFTTISKGTKQVENIDTLNAGQQGGLFGMRGKNATLLDMAAKEQAMR